MIAVAISFIFCAKTADNRSGEVCHGGPRREAGRGVTGILPVPRHGQDGHGTPMWVTWMPTGYGPLRLSSPASKLPITETAECVTPGSPLGREASPHRGRFSPVHLTRAFLPHCLPIKISPRSATNIKEGSMPPFSVNAVPRCWPFNRSRVCGSGSALPRLCEGEGFFHNHSCSASKLPITDVGECVTGRRVARASRP
jgi:hypothetical protein